MNVNGDGRNVSATELHWLTKHGGVQPQKVSSELIDHGKDPLYGQRRRNDMFTLSIRTSNRFKDNWTA